MSDETRQRQRRQAILDDNLLEWEYSRGIRFPLARLHTAIVLRSIWDYSAYTLEGWPTKLYQPYRKIAHTQLWNGYRISTILLSTDHQYDEGEVTIFESMIFGNSFENEDCRRYSTVQEARIGHMELESIWSGQARPRPKDPCPLD